MSFYSLALFVASASAAAVSGKRPNCLYIPGDAEYPSNTEWDTLNTTVGGRLLRGTPVAEVCYGPDANETTCSDLQGSWGVVDHL